MVKNIDCPDQDNPEGLDLLVDLIINQLIEYLKSLISFID